MKIKVTEKHIANGLRDDCTNCAVALAMKEALPKFNQIYVGTRGATGHSRGWIAFHKPLPEEVTEFIISFDRGESVEPFEFELPFDHLND